MADSSKPRGNPQPLPAPHVRRSPPHVRTARPDDAEAIGSVQARAWLAAYAGIAPRQVLSAVTPQRLAAGWQPALTHPPSAAHGLQVAIDSGRVVGFVASDDTGEIVTLVVDPAHQRRGHGSRLLAATADHARAHGLARLGTWCPEDDIAHRTFLESAGFREDGGRRQLSSQEAQVFEIHLAAALDDDSGRAETERMRHGEGDG